MTTTSSTDPVVPMRILIITSCTGEKAVKHGQALTLDDFRQGIDHIRKREDELATLLTPAEELYTGQQHLRLMRGIRQASSSDDLEVDLRILSAGYGLVDANRLLAPYEATFKGMKRVELRTWARELDIPTAMREILARPYDLTLVLLSDDYLEACSFDEEVRFSSPTLFLCGKRAVERLPKPAEVLIVTLLNADAKRFSCGLVALKGELGARILEDLAASPRLLDQLQDFSTDIKALLERPSDGKPARGQATIQQNPTVDFVIHLPDVWRERSQRRRLKYFIPEWDDRVDPDFHYESDTHSGGRGDWSNEVYAHQIYQETGPNYDGILVSRVVAEKSQKKQEHLYEVGVHRHLRVPDDFPILGDCGAFGYIDNKEPPFTTAELLDYYTDLGFNYGVSLDHLIVPATETHRQFRYELTIANAEDFIREHEARGLKWTPIGAVQGWDPPSYAKAARALVGMGYDYIALGGLARSQTSEVVAILEAVHEEVGEGVDIHLFGVARLDAVKRFVQLGLTSFDSASALRRAWLNSNDNYWTLSGHRYAAIRIPEIGKSLPAIRAVQEGRVSLATLGHHEQTALEAIRAYGRKPTPIHLETTLDAVDAYDTLIDPERQDLRPKYRRTLESMPWKECKCAICREAQVEVTIFRGNNRNRRRGFHNTYVFYEILGRTLNGEGPVAAATEAANQQELAFA